MHSLQNSARRVTTLITRLHLVFSTHPFESLFALPIFLFASWYCLALVGLFYPVFVLLSFLLVGTMGFWLFSRKPAFCTISSLLLGIFLTFFLFFAFTAHPIEIVAEGRDQGTFTNSALLLQKSHGFPFTLPEARPFFELYGPGKALNFPGLAYTPTGGLIPEFPLGYIVWLAGFTTLFGLSGFALANSLLYLFSGFLFYRLAKRIIPEFWSFIATLVVMGGFLPLWFISFTLSENLALFWFLLTTEGLMRFRITKDRFTLFLTLTSAFCLALTRIEGWAILGITGLLVLGKDNPFTWIKTHFLKKPAALLWLIVIFTLTLGTIAINLPYYKAIAKALLKSGGQNTSLTTLGSEALPLYHVLFEYGLLIPLFGGVVACFTFWKRRNYSLLIPLFLALPTLPYLLLPHITPDAPWMLRRFVFSLYPALLLSLLWGISLLLQRITTRKSGLLWTLFFGLLVTAQLPALKQLVTTPYQANLTAQTGEIATLVSPRDLVLIDKDVTGDNFMMPARTFSLLFDRPAVYFFNPLDLDKLETDQFERVLLLVPTAKIPFYSAALETTPEALSEFTYVNDHSFRSLRRNTPVLPQKEVLRVPVSLLILR